MSILGDIRTQITPPAVKKLRDLIKEYKFYSGVLILMQRHCIVPT